VIFNFLIEFQDTEGKERGGGQKRKAEAQTGTIPPSVARKWRWG